MTQHQYDDGWDFSQPSAEFLDRQKSLWGQNTYDGRRSDIKTLEKWIEDTGRGGVLSLTWSDIEQFLFHLSNEGYAKSTIQTKYNNVNELYKHLSERGDLENNPMETLEFSDYRNIMSGESKKSEVTRENLPTMTAEEKDLLIQHRPAPKLRNELLFRLLWHTSARQHEIVNTRLRDVDRENRVINIRSNKTHENREVAWSRGAIDLLLDQWLDHGGRAAFGPANESDYLLLTNESEKMKRSVGKVVRKAAENAGIQDVMYVDVRGNERVRISPHTFRHGSALQYLKEDAMDLRTLQIHLGHKSIEVTQIYLDMLNNDVSDTIQAAGVASDAFG